MFFNLVKETNSLRKEINRLLSNGMSNIFDMLLLRRSQNFDFLGLKNLIPRQFLGSSNSCTYHWILKLLVATLWCFKVKESLHFVEQNYKIS